MELDELVDILASAIGSYTNQSKLVRTFKSGKGKTISDKTIKNYIDYLIDSFLISKAVRYDIKGKKYIGSPSKYYFEDVGLRNARLGFRQVEQTHLMENIIYNELRIRGYHVDVGVVEYYGVNGEGNAERSSWRWILSLQKEARNITSNLRLHFRQQIKWIRNNAVFCISRTHFGKLSS